MHEIKIVFENNATNFILEDGLQNQLNKLAEIQWKNKFLREKLHVTFVDCDEFSRRTQQENIEDPAWHEEAKKPTAERRDCHNEPATEWLGCYISFDKQAKRKDSILICPDRIKIAINRHSEKRPTFSSLMKKVFLHELAHSLMTEDPFSTSRTGAYLIPSCKDIEESLCNAFALMHFNGSARSALIEFCRNQPAGYRDFAAWGVAPQGVMLAIDRWKELKHANSIHLQLLHSGFNIDLMSYVQALLRNPPSDKAPSHILEIPPDELNILKKLIFLLSTSAQSSKTFKFQKTLFSLLEIKSAHPIKKSENKISFDHTEHIKANDLIFKIGGRQIKSTALHLCKEHLITIDITSIQHFHIEDSDYLREFQSLPNFIFKD